METFGTTPERKRALILATGQTTSYESGTGVDDGALRIGEAHNYTVLTTGQYAGNTNIVLNGKTDVHANACVYDAATGLMWSRTASASVGPTSNGLLPWTTNGSGEGIFTYAAAANAALLAGYGNWRVPNIKELFALQKIEAPNSLPDATAFPTLGANNLWSSTTIAHATTFACYGAMAQSLASLLAKTSTAQVLLVRGPL